MIKLYQSLENGRILILSLSLETQHI